LQLDNERAALQEQLRLERDLLARSQQEAEAKMRQLAASDAADRLRLSGLANNASRHAACLELSCALIMKTMHGELQAESASKKTKHAVALKSSRVLREAWAKRKMEQRQLQSYVASFASCLSSDFKSAKQEAANTAKQDALHAESALQEQLEKEKQAHEQNVNEVRSEGENALARAQAEFEQTRSELQSQIEQIQKQAKEEHAALERAEADLQRQKSMFEVESEKQRVLHEAALEAQSIANAALPKTATLTNADDKQLAAMAKSNACLILSAQISNRMSFSEPLVDQEAEGDDKHALRLQNG